ncbi:hypothetical protein COLO4_27499 [Corchorus olitorius]|uniref:Uncharacterized protein n=1 Tax=Corchorus olitorius TaxID=93759 RepID=A0A1R3HQR1_9ROSI|nr:hypothetical protein COLO4_27499 [Corchorus olitorius]
MKGKSFVQDFLCVFNGRTQKRKGEISVFIKRRRKKMERCVQCVIKECQLSRMRGCSHREWDKNELGW